MYPHLPLRRPLFHLLKCLGFRQGRGHRRGCGPGKLKGAWELFPGPFDLAYTSVLRIDLGHPLIHGTNADPELCMALA